MVMARRSIVIRSVSSVLCGMNCPLPMRSFIIEELRFFDANGRQGKRHPATKVLE